MRPLIYQTSIHLGARLGSVGLSFLLFAWIGRVLPAHEATKAYFFSFALGFGLATARMCLQLGAAVTSAARTTQRIREAQRGLAILYQILPMLALGIGVVTWIYTSSPLIVALAILVTLVASLDVDLLRGIVGRPSIFSLSFSIGSLLSLFVLQYALPHTLNGVALALLIQWLPVCVFNMPVIRRLWSVTHKPKIPLIVVVSTLALTGFDGLILNAPFLGWMSITTQASLDLSIVMRVFVASLPMLPLMLHWSNSPVFDRLCKRIGVSIYVGFVLILLVSGIMAGSLFLTTFILIAHQSVSLSVIGLYALLLVAYSLLAPQIRFSGTQLQGVQLLIILGTSLMVYLLTLTVTVHAFPSQIYFIVIIQSLTLSTTAAWLHYIARSVNQISNSLS